MKVLLGKHTGPAEAFARLQLQQWSEAASDCDEVDVAHVSHDVSSCHRENGGTWYPLSIRTVSRCIHIGVFF